MLLLRRNSRRPAPPTAAGIRGGGWSRGACVGALEAARVPAADGGADGGNSELPFRMLCRRYGADAAYTPMLHSCIFSKNEKYRSMEFTTCKEDRPLFIQFCANDPDILLQAAKIATMLISILDVPAHS